MPTVTFELEGETHVVEVEKGVDISAALEAAGITPTTVLIKKDGAVVPHRETVSADEEFALVKVISGG